MKSVILSKYDLFLLFMGPVNNKKKNAHANQAVNDFYRDHRILHPVIVAIVVDGILILPALLVFEHSLEVAVENHR
jgi:hypothetical protein